MKKLVSELGKCYRKIDNFGLYKDEGGFLAVYSLFEDEGEQVANFRGYLAHLENWEVVVEDLKYEDKIALAELQAEFGYVS